VLLWVAGFDIIYALQDEEFDRSLQLSSVPVVLGKKKALWLSTFLHIMCAGCILLAGWLLPQTYASFAWLHWLAAGIFIALLIYQHLIVSPTNLSRVNLAFFTTNGVASLVFGTLLILDLYL
jgi:4-hydroxybenzoate polyprenyltransferase